MHYVLPVIPHDAETLREGLVGGLGGFIAPFVLFYIYSKIFPIFGPKDTYDKVRP